MGKRRPMWRSLPFMLYVGSSSARHYCQHEPRWTLQALLLSMLGGQVSVDEVVEWAMTTTCKHTSFVLKLVRSLGVVVVAWSSSAHKVFVDSGAINLYRWSH